MRTVFKALGKPNKMTGRNLPFVIERETRLCARISAARMCAEIVIEQYVSCVSRELSRGTQVQCRNITVQSGEVLISLTVRRRQVFKSMMGTRPNDGPSAMRLNIG